MRLMGGRSRQMVGRIGRQGAMTPSGVAQVLARRAGEAGVDDVHPHRFRHTTAHDWLASGGQEQSATQIIVFS